MKCNKCNQNSIIVKNSDGDIIIECKTCGIIVGGMMCGVPVGDLGDLVKFNIELDKAVLQGHMCYFGGELLDSNPHGSKDIALNKSWEKGWQEAERETIFEALNFSAEKINEEIKKLEALNKKLEDDKKEYKNNYEQVLTYVKCLGVATYKLGRTYRKKIASFLE